MRIKNSFYVAALLLNSAFLLSDIILYDYVNFQTPLWPELEKHYRLWKKHKVVAFYFAAYFAYGFANALLCYRLLKDPATSLFKSVCFPLAILANLCALWLAGPLFKTYPAMIAYSDIIANYQDVRFIDTPFGLMQLVLQPFFFVCIFVNLLLIAYAAYSDLKS